MKIFKRLAVVLILAIMCLAVVACGGKGGGGGGGGGPSTKNLTPADITKLKDLTNYGQESKYYNTSPVTYSDYSAEKAKLEHRIGKKAEDVAENPDSSSVVKIFAASNAEQIILAMSKAALPTAKMTKTVDYLAGETDVNESEIQTKVNTGKWTKTPNWSFFDDWSYYEKLQDRADANGASDEDKDNVKRQYRNIAGKIFAIGMSGDEFARVATYELEYSLLVVKAMAGGHAIGSGQFTKYCKEELDYDTLVYLEAFNEYYGGSANLASCVELYGYYYDYNKNSYNVVSDEDFEKELKYSHYTTYTDAEWLEYVALQRNNYVNAYRYRDEFYNVFYSKHFSFQEKKEDWEYKVFDFGAYNNLTYTNEMRQGITSNGLQGQLNMSDWLWCYSGKEDAMKSYNQANTKYENGKKGSVESENEGKFYFEMEQLKAIDYLLTNMTAQNLSGALRYQIYSYSGSMIQSISNSEKDITLIKADKKEATDVTSVLNSLTGEDVKTYATGKVKAIISQMKASHNKVGVDQKAVKAAGESWSSMASEIKFALNYDYSTITSWEKKVERLEDLVIKRKYSCGVELDNDDCPKGNGHAECTKEYDTNHAISQFASNYEQILKHAAGKVSITFQQNTAATNDKKNNYQIKVYAADLPKTYNCGYGATNEVTADMLAGIDYFKGREISINRGKIYLEEIAEADAKDRGWWNENKSPAKAQSTVQEQDTSNQTGTYTYTYVFSGWYLDKNLIYQFNENDTINCDLELYAGYNVTKK